MRRTYDITGYWDGETYICDYCADEYGDDEEEGLSVYDAAVIWVSNGKDEDYTFGFLEEELEKVL